MGRIIVIVLLGIALFLSGAWYLGLFENAQPIGTGGQNVQVTPEDKLGDWLYGADVKFPVIPPITRPATVATVIHGVMNATENEEVPSPVPGTVLFVGEQVDDVAVMVAGSTAFLAEPYHLTTVETSGQEEFVKAYRRIHDGDPIGPRQMVAMIQPTDAMVEVMAKTAKVNYAQAENEAAAKAEDEGRVRYLRAIELFNNKAMGAEEFGSNQLTYFKLKYEAVSKNMGVTMAQMEKRQADANLYKHEIRPRMNYKRMLVKNILRNLGAGVKQGDPVIVIQSLEKLQAEAQIETQYFTHLRHREQITATIEPSIWDKPAAEFPGHNLDVNSVAVTRDLRVVSGGEDSNVIVWSPKSDAPLHKFEHDSAVKVVACTPTGNEKNLCLAGCADGSIYLWDLDTGAPATEKPITKAHGNDSAITAIAVSPDGKYFATGAVDGSIRLWLTADAKELYAFTPQNGVAQSHEDAVTTLHFTPQSRLISAGRDRTLRVWKLKEKGAVADGRPVRDRVGNVSQLGVSQDGKWMLFDQGKTLQLLSVESRTLKHTLTVPVNSTPFETLAIFSPNGKLMLTAGTAGGRLQLWRTPDEKTRAFEVRQFATLEGQSVACAAFSPDNNFAVSASGHKLYMWSIPSEKEVGEHRIPNVRMTLKTPTLDASTKTTRVGFEVINEFSKEYPNGRFEAGRPVTIVID